MRRVIRNTRAPLARFSPHSGWPLSSPAAGTGVLINDLGLSLGTQGRRPIPNNEPFGTLGGRSLPTGLAISSQGRMFLTDPAARVVLTGLANPPQGEMPSPRLAPLWPARPLPGDDTQHGRDSDGRPSDPYTLVEPVDVACAPNGDLVIVDKGARRVLVLAFPTAYLRHVITFDDHAPIAAAFDRFGAPYVLLRPVKPGAKATLEKYDQNWRRQAPFLRQSVTLKEPSALAAWPDPAPCRTDSAHEGAGEGTCDRDGGCGYGCTTATASHRTTPLVVVLDQSQPLAIGPLGNLLSAAPLPDTLMPPPLMAAPDGTLTYSPPQAPNRAPLILRGVSANRAGTFEGAALPLLARPKRIELPRYGSIILDPIDSGARGFRWDRIGLDLTLPEASKVLISTLTSDSHLAADRVKDHADWSAPLSLTQGQTPEALVQSGPGRYLWIKLELFGDGSRAPLLREIDVFGPRQSALDDLPSLFRQDPESADFLDRFLSYFDTGLNELAAMGRATVQSLDPFAADPEFLPWLASWFDLEFHARLSEDTRRAMILEAITYFRERGTIAGLKRLIGWHTGLSGALPQIIEHYRLAGFDAPPMIAQASLQSGALAHRFSVIVPRSVMPDAASETRLKNLIRASIPAHTDFTLIAVDPGIQLGRQSTIGIDMMIGSNAPAPLGHAHLGNSFQTDGPAPTRRPDYSTTSHLGPSPC